MCKPTPRELAQIPQLCKCQLITGSYDGATNSCDCKSSNKCKLRVKMPHKLYLHPKIVDARNRNITEYENLQRLKNDHKDSP